MAVTGLLITSRMMLLNTSPSAPGALLSAPATSAKAICTGERKLPTTANTAAISVVKIYKPMIVRKRLPKPARAVATDEATKTATNTGAIALSAPTKRSPNIDTTLIPGTVSAKAEPITMPANIRSIKLVCCHFSRIEWTSGGEKRHLCFSDGTFGPDFEPLMEAIYKDSLYPRIICESAGTMAEDALAMKKYYLSLAK